MKLFNIIKRNRKIDEASIQAGLRKNGLYEIRGELEVSAFRNGKQIYYDKGENTVTVFAKHATMHLLTGEAFSSWGTFRSFDESTDHTATGTGEGKNTDETLLSGQQYFSNNTSPDYDLESRWSKSTLDAQIALGDATNTDDDMKYPFFPTKILFGTGFEWADWDTTLGVTHLAYQTAYTDLGWDESTFETQIAAGTNTYSNTWSGSAITKTRSMNDIYTGQLITPVITDTSFGISGAVKGGTYNNSATERYASGGGTIKTEYDGSQEFLTKDYQGIGQPSFIYCRRESRFFQSGSEVQLSYDSDVENKITYTAVMPEQTASSGAENIFYPYNGYTLKVAGLFCDAYMLLDNTEPIGNENYDKMQYGLMYSTRYISPLVKDHTTSVTSRWTLYL